MPFVPIDITRRQILPATVWYPNEPELVRTLEGVLISHSTIVQQVHALAQHIAGDYEGREVQPVVIMNGAKRFYDDLMQSLGPKVELRKPLLLEAKSYRGEQAGVLNVQIHPDSPVDLRSVSLEDTLVVEDIEDTRETLAYIRQLLFKQHPTSLHAVVLLRKVGVQKADLDPSFVAYCGFEIPAKFVVGYGLDHDGKYRDLDDICVYRTIQASVGQGATAL